MTHQMQKRTVIAISGASGAGKSSLVMVLVQTLGDATALHFDDYKPERTPPSIYPLDPLQWLADGADPNAWETPQLAADVLRLRHGESVVVPRKGAVLVSKRWIVLEEPFGRTRTVMRDLIDAVILVDVPLEVALARRLLRVAERPDLLADPDEQARALQTYLRVDHPIGKELYRVITERVRPDCDLVVDGLQPSEVVAASIADWIRLRFEGDSTEQVRGTT
jgi:hypothetical protein